jgi:hypothetical protein
VHAHESEKFQNTRLYGLLGCLENHGIEPVHGMVEL